MLNAAFYANVPGGQNEPFEPLYVEISKSTHRLMLMNGSEIMWDKAVGLGKEGSTPEGDFIVKERVLDPLGSKPGVYGSAGLGLGSFAIHGTNDPSSIGVDLSKGCIRMSNEDVRQLYNFVPKGTKVHIAANSSQGSPESQTVNLQQLLPNTLPQLDETPVHTVFHWLG
ncbi:L,D-transpeptidase [Paenibacillus hexagrammi]|uniref:L,D-transpeptidase n=1 Tax=Paenibacillus hexagrammi TaxID=2908839 RepID=A0ABY3SR34_9BACL|nr:L,D-transpeptidase [Paenibacillus sp. YPD9-1]UJF35865.1 L,D-transpeptidase [Paenibacillus sp. YPD9-1]